MHDLDPELMPTSQIAGASYDPWQSARGPEMSPERATCLELFSLEFRQAEIGILCHCHFRPFVSLRALIIHDECRKQKMTRSIVQID
jgi:hypothetical protein